MVDRGLLDGDLLLWRKSLALLDVVDDGILQALSLLHFLDVADQHMGVIWGWRYRLLLLLLSHLGVVFVPFELLRVRRLHTRFLLAQNGLCKLRELALGRC